MTSSEAKPVQRRGRRPIRQRPTGDERFDAILQATRDLLQTQAGVSITVAEVATGAGISRTTFYFYFPSVDDVFETLLGEVVAQTGRELRRVSWRSRGELRESWAATCNVLVAMWHRNWNLLTTASTLAAAGTSLGHLWAKTVQEWTSFCGRVIASEQVSGRAPTGIDGPRLAEALSFMTEGMLANPSAQDRDIADSAAVVDELTSLWLRFIYGQGAHACP